MSSWSDVGRDTREIFGKKKKNVSCEYDRWVVETQLCKLRDTSDTLIGRVLVLLSICDTVLVNYIYDTVVDTKFHKSHGRPVARVLYAMHVFMYSS